MEKILEILTVLGPILVPLLVAYMTSRAAIGKHSKEEYADEVKNAKEFEKLIGKQTPNLIKDRVAQQLFQSKKVSFREVIYFRQFENMEYWVRYYLSVKKFIQLNRDEQNNIISLSFKKSFWRRVSYLIIYSLSMGGGLFLVLWFELVNDWLSINLNWPDLASIAIVISWAVILISIGSYNLIMLSKYTEAKKFMSDFEKDSIRLN
ncbi:hypothetical protein NVT87_15235 [Acinetobacter radioresistens]|uniref:hypothetical protein n=1 Tax=Acinetobacter radioresistens TaxID=40216 RepID=UPI002247592C|nr:hypothetical protein [Acinetobacter radioresistens]MCX0332221.1 hypothetical protein [Acinetobacter radioresistens]